MESEPAPIVGPDATRLRVSSYLPIKCRCGSFRGIARGVSREAGNRLICYCDDCQSFAEFLGRADEILDTHGGTDIFQMSPARLEIVAGKEHLACIRLTPKGVFRWYTDCCKTPVGNTLPTGRIAFVGLIHSCMQTGGKSREEALGPVHARINARYAKGDRSELDAHDRVPLSVLVRVVWKLLHWRLRGDRHRSPFFDTTGAVTSVPRALYRQNSS